MQSCQKMVAAAKQICYKMMQKSTKIPSTLVAGILSPAIHPIFWPEIVTQMDAMYSPCQVHSILPLQKQLQQLQSWADEMLNLAEQTRFITFAT